MGWITEAVIGADTLEEYRKERIFYTQYPFASKLEEKMSLSHATTFLLYKYLGVLGAAEFYTGFTHAKTEDMAIGAAVIVTAQLLARAGEKVYTRRHLQDAIAHQYQKGALTANNARQLAFAVGPRNNLRGIEVQQLEELLKL